MHLKLDLLIDIMHDFKLDFPTLEFLLVFISSVYFILVELMYEWLIGSQADCNLDSILFKADFKNVRIEFSKILFLKL